MNAILETLRRPVRADQAMKISLALVAMGVALTAAHALTKPATPEMPRIETASAMKPVILAVDWQEGGHDENRSVAVAYAR